MNKITRNNQLGPGPGRPKGSPNKLNGSMKEMIMEAFEKAGGAEWLARQADENPVAFMGLLGKLIPADIALSAQVETIPPPEVPYATIEEIREELRRKDW